MAQHCLAVRLQAPRSPVLGPSRRDCVAGFRHCAHGLLLQLNVRVRRRSARRLVVCKTTSDSAELLDDRWKWRKTTKELAAYGGLLVAVPVIPLLPRFQFSAALYFGCLSLWAIYVGSHRSLDRPKFQQVSFKQGLLAPVVFSMSLFSLYCILRFFPDLDLRAFFSIYFISLGGAAVGNNLVNPFKLLFPKLDSISTVVEVPEELGLGPTVRISAAQVAAFVAGAAIAIASRQTGAPFALNNFMAICMATELLYLLSVGSFSTAAVILCGLLFYDVFWVFGSSAIFGDNVMLKVATSSVFDGPTKLVFPSWKANSLQNMSVLGLGDIAIPGLLMSLMLRFDKARCPDVQNSAQKTYFVNCVAAYVVGLALTIVANTVTDAAQPALLYLVPSLLCGAVLTALSRSEAPLLFGYRDDKPDDNNKPL